MKQILMLSTFARGGIRSVVDAYRISGFSDRWNVREVWTHCEGSIFKKLNYAVKAFLDVFHALLFRKVKLFHLHISMRGSVWRKGIFVYMAKFFSVPVLIHLHGSEFKVFYESLGGFGKSGVQHILNKSDCIVVLSQSWSVYLKKITTTDVKVVANFVFDFNPPENTVRNDKTLLFLGQFGQRKGIYDLLECLARIKQRGGEFFLLCGGNGDEKTVRSLVAEYDLNDRVEVLGWVTGEKKLLAISKASVFVLPSYNEGLPMAILEAMSAKMAVISTNVGGIPQMIDDRVEGLLVSPGDQGALENALEHLLQNPICMHALGDAGYQRWKNEFSPDQVLKKMNAIYEELIERR